MLCYILYMKDMGEVLEKELIDNLLNKSEEAFLMAIEIYNKPTIIDWKDLLFLYVMHGNYC